MRRLPFGLLVVGALLTGIEPIASADDSKDEEIKKDFKQIDGTWWITSLAINGNKATEKDCKALTMCNNSDGTWSLSSEDGKGKVWKGTSTIDPTKTPKTIDFTPTEGEGKGEQYVGIYELFKNTRRLCFAPQAKGRPTDFSSLPDSGRILVSFERQKGE